MSSRLHKVTRAAALAAVVVLCALAWHSPARAQSDDIDPEARIQQLENQLRQLTGQNEELQYRNRQLEERLRMLQGGAQAAPQGVAPGQPGAAPLPGMAALPPVQQAPTYQQPPGGYQSQVAAPVVQEPAGMPAQGRRRGDAFDPNQNPNAPGAPRALGGGQLPVPAEAPIGAPGGRGAGEPLDLANTGGPPAGALPPPPPRNPNGTGALTTLPPSATPKDEFDLGVGYIQRKDYALAEETMRNFERKYPSDPLMAEAQFWLGESFFQRQLYRDAAEAFLAVTTKFDRSAKAPDALLRLGQSLAALKEKEAACAAFGEVARKYPRAAGNIKQAIDREQKRVKC
jgi:tol-pal system protein YbgF